MSVSIEDFWKLVAQSRLLAPPQVQRLAAEFGQEKHAATPTAKTAAQWLMNHRAISKYQALVLLAGKPGPFFYGPYKVYERIEQGRLAGCFRAVHDPTKHPVVLRFLAGAYLHDANLWAAATRNANFACEISSPHVQRYFEAVDLKQFKFLVSEDLRGTTLEPRLAGGRVVPGEACRLMRMAALGLAEMHSLGRVHGDVRPGNMLLEGIGDAPATVKLLFDADQVPQPVDFGQQQAGGPLDLTADYLAPELQAPGRPPSAAADIYALGCTLYALLAGSPPFAGGGVQQKLARHASEVIKPLQALGLPPAYGGLSQVMNFLTAKDPAGRYQSAAQVAEQLAMYVDPTALRLAPPAPPPTLAAYDEALRQRPAQGPQAKSRESSVGGQKSEVRGQAAAAGVSVAVGGHGTASTKPLTTAEQILLRRKAQQTRNLLIRSAVTAAVLLVAVGGLGIWWVSQPSQSPRAGTKTAVKVQKQQAASASSPAGRGGDATSGGNPSIAAGAGGLVQQVVPDDGQTLWVSPTSGGPVSFRCVPPEGQVFLILRPAAMLTSDEGQRVFAALGPTVESQRRAWEAVSGFKLEEISRLIITLHNNEAKFPRVSFVVKTVEELSTQDLLARWSNPGEAKEQGATYYTGPTWAYYISSASDDERTFAMGEPRDIKDVAAAAGKEPAVFREIERLRRMTDSERHFTLLFYPQFLFNDDGEPLFAAERAKVRWALEWLLGDHVQAACVSGYFGDLFYFEARLRGSLDKEPFALAQELRERLNRIPRSLEDYFVALDPPTYWKKLAFRYPSMVRELHSQMRIGVENDIATINSVLPPAAAHNLVLGGELLVSTTPGQSAAVAAAPAAAGPKTVAEALQIKTSFTFDNQSLEFAMRDLADDVKGTLRGAPFEFAIKIIGDDLKLDGITRNQSIRDFNQENQTVADILTALVRKANPDPSVRDPSETNQKLVWVIGPDPDNPGKQIILITTRTASTAKRYNLPAPFVAKK